MCFELNARARFPGWGPLKSGNPATDEEESLRSEENWSFPGCYVEKEASLLPMKGICDEYIH
jgi:hypothetical protein